MGYDATGTYGFLNDLWEFNAALKQWEWVGGSNSIPCFECGVVGEYGEFQVPAAGNIPGGRPDATRWTDAKGNFWLFGGLARDARDIRCY
jgi:hypothetical protein